VDNTRISVDVALAYTDRARRNTRVKLASDEKSAFKAISASDNFSGAD
jgi:hypothetical protein